MYMKKLAVFVLAAMMPLALVGCSSGKSLEKTTGDIAPRLTIEGTNYVAPYMPVNELPEGYVYTTDITEEQANDTGLAGCKMYDIPERDSLPDFYVYQECGTPIDENTIDSTKIQWAYVQWVQENT